MKIRLAPWLFLASLSVTPAFAASPSDLVPQGSGLYDAVALLNSQHLLLPGSPDATALQGLTGRLYTRRELADIVRSVTDVPADPRAAAALAFCRNLLAPELGTPDEPYPSVQNQRPLSQGLSKPKPEGVTTTVPTCTIMGNCWGAGACWGRSGVTGHTRSA